MWRGFLLAVLCVRGWSLRTAGSSVGQISRFSTAVIQSDNDTDSLIGNGEAQRLEADVLVLLGSLLSRVYSGSRLLVLQDDYYSGVGFLFRSVHSSLSWDGIEVTSCQADALESWVRDSFRAWPSDIVALLICSASNAWDILQWVSEKKDEPTSLLKSVHWTILAEDGGLMPKYESILTEESQFTVAQMEPDEAVTLLVTAFLQNGRMGFVPVGRWWRFQGGWSHKLNRPLTSLAHRQQFMNLQGRVMKVAAVDNWPWFGLKAGPTGEPLPDTGIDASIITTISQALNFTIEVVIPEDGQWGGPQPDGTVSGLIGMVSMYKAHFAIDEITITASRETVVDFTFPYYIESSTCVSRTPKEKSRAFAVFSPFTPEVWLVLGLSVFAYSFAIYVTNLLSLSTPDRRRRSSKDMTLDRITYSTFRSLVRMDNTLVPPSWSIRYLFGAWYLYCYYINSVYSGVLTAYLSVPSYEKPIDSLSDLLGATDKGFYPVIFREGSIDFLFKSATSGVYRDIGNLISGEKNYVDVIADGVAATLSSKAVYIEARLASEMQTLKQGQEKFYMGRQSFFPQSYGIVCRTRSPFKSVMSDILSHLNEGGLINKWKKEQVLKLGQNPVAGGRAYQRLSAVPSALTIEHLQGGFFVYVIGIFVTSLAFLVERQNLYCRRASKASQGPKY